jgi:hypothetical protein
LGDVEINQERFEKGVDEKYVWKPFASDDVINNTLEAARGKKIDKYAEIIKDART